MKHLLVKVDWTGGGEWEFVAVPTYPASRLMAFLRRLRLLKASISGWCPRGVHLRDDLSPANYLTWCHEVSHYIKDYLTAPWPRDLTHPTRSLWGMRKGYRNAPREIRAYGEQQSIADGNDPHIRPGLSARAAFGLPPL